MWDIRLVSITWPWNPVRGHSRSLEISPVDRAHTTSYWRSIVTMALSRVVSQIFNVEKRRDLEIGCKIRVYHCVSGHRGHRHCLCGSPAYLGRPDPLSFKLIGRQFESGLARRNWPSLCSAGGLSLFLSHFTSVSGRLHMGVCLYVEHAVVAWMSVFVKTRCRR